MNNITKKCTGRVFEKNFSFRSLWTRITISDLTTDCGISRMAFYYHLKTFMTW